MDKVNNIVVVVNRSDDAQYVLHKAAIIAKSNPDGASVHVIRVMYEDFVEQTHLDEDEAHQLKLYLMQAEEEFLVDLVEDHRANFTDIETATLWNKRVSDAVINGAETFKADFIIKSADPESPHFPRHPDDWNLLRGAECPVFLVKPEPWHDQPAVIAAVNVADVEHEDMNKRVAATASSLAESLEGKLVVVNAVPQSNPLLMGAELGVDFERLEREVNQEIHSHLDDLLSSIDVSAEVHVVSGQPATVITYLADETNAAAVVAGTAGRKGVSGMIIGNTSETLLHTLHHDLLVLHV